MKDIMLQGTGSNVGKTVFAAGLCRLAKNKRVMVAPFKPQNMSNNSFITIDNGEIGRSQAFQAFACGIEPHSDMNPILLKPETNSKTQIIVKGKLFKTIESKNYKFYKRKLLEIALDSYFKLKKKYDFIVVEGAGSPAEINLRHNDLANMGFALRAKIPVILIGDIDRGGVIAQIVGTKEVLSKKDRDLIIGFLINKFRGELSLFQKGYQFIERKTNWEGYGVLPWYDKCHQFPAEDSFDISFKPKQNRRKIACLQLSRISNFDDLNPLSQEPDISVEIIKPGNKIPKDADLVIIPGSKSTIDDLIFLKKNKWDSDLKDHLKKKKYILGICAGYQMLGKVIFDKKLIESNKSQICGLGLLNVITEMKNQKKTIKVSASHCESGITFSGYEIHIGETKGEDCSKPFASINHKWDGAISKDGLVMGSYIHGMFENNNFRSFFMKKILGINSSLDYQKQINQNLDEFADFIRTKTKISKLLNF